MLLRYVSRGVSTVYCTSYGSNINYALKLYGVTHFFE
nr:MAG TPA: hypothetical protein [Caudoviricetes sp.]